MSARPAGRVPAPGAMARLRAATAARHARLERVTGLPERLRTRADLVAALERLHGFHAAVEALAAPAAFWERLDLAHCAVSRRAWLAEDLLRLGADPARVAALPLCPGLLPHDDEASRLGRAYVVEGSALGGRALGAHVARHALADGPLRFFAAHGAATGTLWRRFGRTLEARARAADAETRAVAAANATFDALIDWFTPTETSP